jgi:methylmalonyl-CoA/ethylmalonyl-CoA epimerase
MQFHHAGVACRSLEKEIRWYSSVLGYHTEGASFDDPLQGIRGQFMLLGNNRVELLEPLDGSNVLDAWLGRRSPIYHFGFEVVDLVSAIEAVTVAGAKVMSDPKPAVAFAGRHVAFCIRPNLTLIELIESARPT